MLPHWLTLSTTASSILKAKDLIQKIGYRNNPSNSF